MLSAELRSRFFSHLFKITLLVGVGTAGYMLLERWGWLDALFMTVTTITTVGFEEVHPLSVGGKLYTIVLILCGVGVALYILGDIVQIVMEANPSAIFGMRRMKQKIAGLSGHQIVCGYGRTGQEVASHFLLNKVPMVVVESSASVVRMAEEQGLLVLQGDASSDEVLLEAGVQKAKGIVCALPDDTDNTFIALSAKGLNENIAIVSRAANPGSEAKMKRAGAHMVISPYVICGRRMAAAVTHPLVTEFLDVIMHAPGHDLRMEQVLLAAGSSLCGSTLKDANLKQTSGVMILAVNRSGKLITNPSPDVVFDQGDELIALGTEEQLNALERLCGSHHL
jgi:voltage-gated potassium channel